MLQLILGGLWFVAWAITIILMYYSTFYSSVNHIESATGYSQYLISIVVIYLLYKALVVFIFPQKQLKFTFLKISGIVLAHIFLIAVFYTSFIDASNSPFMNGTSPSGFTLFFHIITLLAYPITLVFLMRSAGFTLMQFLLKEWREFDMRIRVPVEISLGFFLFVPFLLLIGWFGYYNLTGLLLILGLFAIGWYIGHKETYNDIKTRSVILENHTLDGSLVDAVNLKLLSIDFGFFFLTFLLSVALVNALRPMPIGWDDLGVYMNYPKIMATSWFVLHGAGMFVWQLITGTGFLFSYTAAQAFYVNQLGWILVVIAIISTLSYVFAEKGKKSLLSLPVLCAAIFYAMPMTVFQQAKDMKIDPAFLFFAVSSLMLLFTFWKGNIMSKTNLTILALAGLLIGFTFSVKFTAVMLIVAWFGLISYRLLSLNGYIGFFFLFLAIFTQFDFWTIMNVQIPKSNPWMIQTIVIAFFVLGLLSIFSGLLKKNTSYSIKNWVISCLIFLISIGVGVSPWIIKNVAETKKVSMSAILAGSGWTMNIDYTAIYTKDEVAALEKKLEDASKTTDGQSQNEDMGRYFGYEKWLNNYLKLPANLTFQANQNGEFTDITYIFLALVPAMLLFVRGRRWAYGYFSGVLMLFMMAYFFFPFLKGSSLFWSIGTSLTAFFNLFTGDKLLLGYSVLIGSNLLFVTLAHFLPQKSEANDKLRDTMMFMGIYAFLFVIAGSGIVWYGIVIYYCFFLIIGFAASGFLNYGKSEESNDDYMGLSVTLAALLFIFISVYFIRSAFPHGWNNLKSAYYNEFKFNILSQEESIFAYRSDYLTPIATLNLKNPSLAITGIQDQLKSADIKKFLENPDDISLEKLHELILKYRNSKNADYQHDLHLLGKSMYSKILYPSKQDANMGWIYRIGTFMTYLINENRKRYLEDSLIFTFNSYFYDPSPEVTIERMKKMGLRYLLVDLNAATIDRDSRHALTDRFEKLLLTMNAKNLRLVSTDNYCLEFALAERQKGKLKKNDEFIDIAGTNYESYRNGGQIYRWQKLAQCQNYILTRINEWADAEYPVLSAIKSDIISQWATTDQKKLQSILSRYAGQSWFALFEITDLPSGFVLPVPTTPESVTPTDSPVVNTLNASWSWTGVILAHSWTGVSR